LNTQQMGQLWIEGKVIKFNAPANAVITMIL
jgi:hypothetical protein